MSIPQLINAGIGDTQLAVRRHEGKVLTAEIECSGS